MCLIPSSVTRVPYSQSTSRLARLGWRPRRLPVGERGWFHAPSERFFRFYTQPRVAIDPPNDPSGTDFGGTLFRRFQDVMLQGGFSLWDLGRRPSPALRGMPAAAARGPMAEVLSAAVSAELGR